MLGHLSRKDCQISDSKIDDKKTAVAGRLALLTKQIVGNSPRIAYRAILGVIKATAANLKANGFIHQKLVKKPMLSEINRLERKEFSKNFIDKTSDFGAKCFGLMNQWFD